MGRRIEVSDAAALERPHGPGPEPDWCEAWEVDLATADGRLGALARLVTWPAGRRTWCEVAVVGEGRPLVTMVEHEAPALRGPGLDLRCEGLWTDQTVETPLAHVTVGLEAFGVALDDPVDALAGCLGHRTPIGFDLEWESDPAAVVLGEGAYELPCEVHGELLLGDEVLAVEAAWGRRRHTWGRWRRPDPRAWGEAPVTGPWAAAAVVDRDERGLPAAARVVTDVGELRLEARHHAPVARPDGSHLLRALGVVVGPAGPAGWGWVELA